MTGTMTAQIQPLIAIPDFSYDGELWHDEFGGAVADALISRLRMDGDFVFSDREAINKLLLEYGVEDAYDADLSRSALAFRRIRALYAIVGRVTKFEQIQEVENRVTVQLVVDFQFIDPYSPYIISSERVETNTQLDKLLPDDAPWDKEIASKILRPAITRIRYRFLSMLRTQQMLRP